MLLIGLTGGIGSGKSLVASHLGSLGAYVLDADKIAHEIIEPGRPAYDDILSHFGSDILAEDGTIDRRALGAIVFDDEEQLRLLSSLTHPRVYEEQAFRLQRIHEQDPDAVVIMEVALLLEAGVHRTVHHVMLTYCEREQQVKRVMERDGFDRETAELRLKAQWPLIEKVPFADFIIDTSDTVEWTIRQVETLYPQLVELAEDAEEEEE